jgi:hypothetical protein
VGVERRERRQAGRKALEPSAGLGFLPAQGRLPTDASSLLASSGLPSSSGSRIRPARLPSLNRGVECWAAGGDRRRRRREESLLVDGQSKGRPWRALRRHRPSDTNVKPCVSQRLVCPGHRGCKGSAGKAQEAERPASDVRPNELLLEGLAEGSAQPPEHRLQQLTGWPGDTRSSDLHRLRPGQKGRISRRSSPWSPPARAMEEGLARRRRWRVLERPDRLGEGLLARQTSKAGKDLLSERQRRPLVEQGVGWEVSRRALRPRRLRPADDCAPPPASAKASSAGWTSSSPCS